jgi:hypothetical protein
LLRPGRLKSEAPIATPQSSSAVKARTTARHRSKAKLCFAEAKKAPSLGQCQLRIGLFNQAESLAAPVPRHLLTRVKTLRQARLWPRAIGQRSECLATYPNKSEAHYPSPSPGSKQIGNHGDHRTLTINHHGRHIYRSPSWRHGDSGLDPPPICTRLTLEYPWQPDPLVQISLPFPPKTCRESAKCNATDSKQIRNTKLTKFHHITNK